MAYPRSRGATVRTDGSDSNTGGLSPLPRGNHTRNQGDMGRQGPIPAPAGQPAEGRRMVCLLAAYPRSRGATGSFLTELEAILGLSPLPRGNL